MKSYLLFSHILVLIIGLGLCHNISGQSKISSSLTVGATTRVLDNGPGIHLGINPALELFPKIHIEAQISYVYGKITSSFISGNKGKYHTVNLLIGPRVYLNSDDKINRFYLNLLVGLNYLNEEIGNITRPDELSVGLSTGAYAEINKIVLGLAYETPSNYVIKTGYKF